MLFNSVDFLLFLCVFFAGWPLVIRSVSARHVYLIVFSFIFYSWNTPWWLLLLIFDGLVDYGAALGMVRFQRAKAAFLALSLTANLGLLFVFKYSAFVLSNLGALAGLVGATISVPERALILPIGISFYTFQSLSYTIGTYRGIVQPTKSITHFFAYISLWPQLVAGPIERANRLLPQLLTPRIPTGDEAWTGLGLIVRGYFKKMVIADNLAPIVNAAFGSPVVAYDALYWWAIACTFAVQIYGDFSGYTDIARGLARWLGYDLMLNFDHPYGALGIRDFWKRWHISLSVSVCVTNA